MASRGLRSMAALAALVVGCVLPAAAASAAPAGAGRSTGVSGPGRQVVAVAGGPAPASASTTTNSDAPEAPATTGSAVAGPVTANFSVTYDGFPANARAAFQAAVDVWSHLISSPVPIAVLAHWAPLGANILGSAGPTAIEHDFTGRPAPNTWYAVALANARFGGDLNGGTPEIEATFNSTFSSWYLGTDGSPGGSQYDLETIVVHELAHGLGFIGSTGYSTNNGSGSWGVNGLPFAFDRFTENGAGTPIISYPSGSVALGTQLTSGSVYFDGPKADAADGGNRPQLYAPATWSNGSSYSHLDETAFPPSDPNSLMTPLFATQEVHHAPGPIVLGVMGDMGWADIDGIAPSLFAPAQLDFGTVASPNPGNSMVVITNVGAQTLTITGSTPPAAPFSATMPSNGTTVGGGKSLGIPVSVDGSTPGYPTGSLSLQTTGGNTTVNLTAAVRSHTPTQAYVIAAYTDFLQRAPNPSELASYTSQLDSGALSPSAFISQLSTSLQWVNAIVTGFYQNTLGRPPDASGLSFWTNAIRNGTYTVAQVAAQFYSSDEYFNGIGGGTNSSWVNDLYVKLLGRSGDSSGVSFWVSQIPKVGRVGVVLPFYQSSESAHHRVYLLYAQLLGRAPDQGGWDYWAGQVVTAGDISLATSLAVSFEYYIRSQLRFP